MHDQTNAPVTVLGRRRAIQAGLAATCGVLFGRDVHARNFRTLDLYAVNTGERLSVDYVRHGRYEQEALLEVNRIMRDHRSGDVHPMDPGLLDLVHTLTSTLGSRHPAHVVCGYRSPHTNARKLASGRHVARNSYHLRGQAVDLFFPDRSTRNLRQAALRLGRGGVGYYPGSGFVHVDTGPVRAW